MFCGLKQDQVIPLVLIINIQYCFLKKLFFIFVCSRNAQIGRACWTFSNINTPGALVLFKWATSKLNVASWIFAYELYGTLGVKKCQDSKKKTWAKCARYSYLNIYGRNLRNRQKSRFFWYVDHDISKSIYDRDLQFFFLRR